MEIDQIWSVALARAIIEACDVMDAHNKVNWKEFLDNILTAQRSVTLKGQSNKIRT